MEARPVPLDTTEPGTHGDDDAVQRKPTLAHLTKDNPIIWRIQPRLSLADARMSYVAQPVPNQPADVQLVVDDAGTAFGVAVDRTRAQRSAGRPRALRAFAIARRD